MDKVHIKKIFEGLGIAAPQIKNVLLCNSGYFQSASFGRKTGIGKSIIEQTRGRNIDHLISWKQLFEAISSNDQIKLTDIQNKMLEKADWVK